jgi:predicted kinase
MQAILIAMAGLPGSGKSALARRLAELLPAVILDKDAVRAALFPPQEIEYSARQDDLCMEALLLAADFLLRKGRSVILDGRPFVRRVQVERVVQFAREGGFELCFVECTCADEVIRQRLDADVRNGAHPAANRSYAMYLQMKAAAEPLEVARLTVDTHTDLDVCAAKVMEYLLH